MECKKVLNEKQCACPDVSCKRHGVCCECVRYHKSTGSLPKCLR